MSIWDKVKQRHATMKEIRRLQALANRGLPGHEPKIASLQDELRRSFGNVPASSEKPYVPYSAPPGSYGFDAHLSDRSKAEQESGGEVQIVRVPVTALGFLPAFNPFYADCDAIQLIARTIDEAGNLTESSDTARIFIKINTPGGSWLPVGYGQVPQGGYKGDVTVFAGTIKRFWIQVQTVTLDQASQPLLLLALLRHVSIVAPSGSSGLYGSPTASQQGQQQPVSPSAASGRGSAPSAPSAPGVPSGPVYGGGGGGDTRQCPLSGAPVRLYGNPDAWEMHVAPCEDFIRITTASGREGTFSPQHRAYQRRGLLPLVEWNVGDYALTEDGEERVTELTRLHLPGATVDGYHAKSGHVYSAFGFIGHNVKL